MPSSIFFSSLTRYLWIVHVLSLSIPGKVLNRIGGPPTTPLMDCKLSSTTALNPSSVTSGTKKWYQHHRTMGLNQTRNNGDPADEEKVEPDWSHKTATAKQAITWNPREKRGRGPSWRRWSKTEGGNVPSMTYVPKGIQRPNWRTKQKIYDSGRQFKSNLISSWRLFLDSGKKFTQKQCIWLKRLFNFLSNVTSCCAT